MSRISEESTLNVKLIVKLTLLIMYHMRVYMRPRRYGEGYALTTESDMEVAQKEFDIFKKETKGETDLHNVEFLEPVVTFWNEDFALREEQIQKALEDDAKTDFYLIRGLRISSYSAAKLSRRTNKSIGHAPNRSAIPKCDHVGMTAHLFAGEKSSYAFLDFKEMNHIFTALRMKKALTCTKIFFPLRGAMLIFGCQNSYLSLEDTTRRFKARLFHMNSDEVFQWLNVPTGKEKAEAKALADKLEKESQGVYMPAEYIPNDTEFYEIIKKMMTHRDCNAFTIPCFEVCAIRELNHRRLTFCLVRSLFKGEGVASACTGDVGSVLTITILMNIAGKVPYMGSTMVLDKNTNQCRTLHSMACARMKGYDEPALPTEFVSPTMDSRGITMRYDFSKDNGETLIMINVNPDMKKIMATKDTINGYDDYLTPECRHAVRYTVKDVRRFHKCQKSMGRHFALVYGDYAEEAKAFAKECDLEVLRVQVVEGTKTGGGTLWIDGT